jgi:benzodiazapine receptor
MPLESKKRQVYGLVTWSAVCYLVAAMGAVASSQADSFYAQLERPYWAPPSWVFGPVWTILYGLMAIAAWLVWLDRESRFVRVALFVFVLQLIFNALWSWLFFGWRQGGLGFVDVVLLCGLIVVTLVRFWRIRPLAGALLVPYLLWVAFAAALNYSVWKLNPSLL